MTPIIAEQTADTSKKNPLNINEASSSRGFEQRTQNFAMSYDSKIKPYIPKVDSLANQNISLYIKNVNLEGTVLVMKKAITALLKNIDYSGYYNAFLLGQLSEKEFEKISDEFAIDYNDSDDTESIEMDIELLVNATGKQFSASDITDIFLITDEKADNILRKLNR